jgi:polysaccharide export outer membrane protein
VIASIRHRLAVRSVLLAAVAMVGSWYAEAQPTPTADVVAGSGVQRAGDAEPEDAQGPALKLSSIEALRRFEPAADEEYTLGAGDEISIQYPGRPELAATSTIGPDGRITLPLAGPIMVAGLTREAAAEKIASAQLAYYTNITATVEVVKYGSNHITLLGNVRNPGDISFDRTPTLLEVLSRGGIEQRPDGTLPDQCVIYRGDLVLWVNLQNLLETGSPLADLRLRRNDLVFVPVASTSITVVGQVQHPGEIVLRRDSTLVSILGEAGGVTDAAGNNPQLEIVHRFKGGRTQYIRLNDLLRPTGGSEISLYPGDVVFVPRSGLAKFGFVLQQLSPALVLGSLATIAVH